MSRATLGLSAVAAVTAIALTGCGSSGGSSDTSSSDTTNASQTEVSQPTVPQAEVEKQTVVELTKTVGQKPDDGTCPGDLTAKVGATMTCVLTDGETKVNVGLTVTSVKDGNARFHIKVADHPN